MGVYMECLLFLLAVVLVSPVKGASNSTDDAYTEPEEIKDSIPVAVTLLVILLLLLLIFIIILLIVCIRLMSRKTRRKDIQDERADTTHNRQQYDNVPMTTYKQQQPAQRQEPASVHQQSQQQPQSQVVYVPPQQPQPYTQPQQTVQPGKDCHCEACEEIRLARKEGRAPNV